MQTKEEEDHWPKEEKEMIKNSEEDKGEKDKPQKELKSMVCLVPGANQLFVAQKSCLVLHFNKTDDNERILNLEKKSGKNWLDSMKMNQKKSSIKRSMKVLMFGQNKN